LVLQAALLTSIASIRTAHPALTVTPKIFHCDPGEGFGFEGTHFVELSEAVVQEKIRIINLHDSQMSIMRKLGGDWAEEHRQHCREVGARAGVPYAEMFRPCLASRRVPLSRLLP
jgi:hypothetical protein